MNLTESKVLPDRRIAHNKVIGIIPARGGSKGIPKKNIYPLSGKPLIAYTIECAKGSRFLTKWIVSTDSEEIASVARAYGAEVPFIRPSELATDSALSVDVVKHAVLIMEQEEACQYDYVVLLQPTTPFRLPEYIDLAVKKLMESGCDTVVTMVDVGAYHPARMYRIVADRLAGIMDEGIAMRPRQELPPVYIRSGDVYACKRSVIFDKNSMMGDDCRPIVIPPERAVNIDDMKDMVLAEYYLNATL